VAEGYNIYAVGAVEIAFLRRVVLLVQPSEDGVPDSETHFRHMAMGPLWPCNKLVFRASSPK
jgi:hypothetical protein